MTIKPRLLILEDNPNVALALYTALLKFGYAVDTAKTAASGLRKISSKNYNVILLDLGLPDMSGLALCKKLRGDGITTPIIVLTGENTIRSKVALLDAGVNDYVSKPFSFDELHARLKTHLRSPEVEIKKPLMVAGAFALDPINRSVERESITIPLTHKEFAIMECLMHRAGQPVTRASLLQQAWTSGSEAWTNTIDVHIKRLRDKVDRPFAVQYISTVHGIGYKLLVPNFVANKQ